jgi:hypothetical protein
MPAEWVYSNWVTFAVGSAERLTRYRLYIKELSDALKSGNYSVEGKSHEFDIIQKDLADLRKLDKTETAAAPAATGGNRSSFTRGVSFRW